MKESLKNEIISSVKIDRGLPKFFVNGRPVTPCGYMSYQVEKADYEGFKKAGVRLLFLPVYTGDHGINPRSGTRPFYPGFWVGEDQYDFSAVQECFQIVIGDSKPGEIWIIPRLMLEPPSFWIKSHPAELCRDFSGSSVRQCYSSEVWFQDTIHVMEVFQKWLEETGFDVYTAGWQIACGHTEEFMRPLTHDDQFTDYSERGTKAWQEFLEKEYGNIEKLNQAWQTSYSTFSEVNVPTPAKRTYVPDGERIYPASVGAYNRFRSVETAMALTRLAGEAKRIVGGKRVIGAFYGYAGNLFGHSAIDLVLNCPDVDFLASPMAYDTRRAPGTDWVLPAPLASVRLHQKAWFVECDVRTHLSRPISISMPRANPIGNTVYDAKIWYGPDTEELSVEQMKKAFMKTLSHGACLWWFDMWGGWYQTPAYMNTIEKALKSYENHADEGPVSQVAVIFDPYDEGKRNDGIRIHSILQTLAHTGAAFELFHVADFDQIAPGPYHSLLFFNVHDAHPDLTKWKKDSRSVIFVNASEDFEEPLYSAAFEGGHAAVFDDWQKFTYEEVPSAASLRKAFLMAGTHIYNYQDDIIYAFGNLLAIHAASDGEKRIYLPELQSLKDAFTGECLIPCEHFTDFCMKKGETRIFEII